MNGELEAITWLGSVMDWTAWSSDPIFGSWLPLLGVMVGMSIFFAWQRRHNGVHAIELDVGSLPSYRRSQESMGAELARMRRYERSLSVIVLRHDESVARGGANGVGSNGNTAQAPAVHDPSLAFWEIGAVLRDVLRDSDVATTDMSKMQYIVLLPETNHERAAQTATRIRKLVYSTTGLSTLTGVADFPSQGLILDELVKSAEENCKQRQTVHGMVAN